MEEYRISRAQSEDEIYGGRRCDIIFCLQQCDSSCSSCLPQCYVGLMFIDIQTAKNLELVRNNLTNKATHTLYCEWKFTCTGIQS